MLYFDFELAKTDSRFDCEGNMRDCACTSISKSLQTLFCIGPNKFIALSKSDAMCCLHARSGTGTTMSDLDSSFTSLDDQIKIRAFSHRGAFRDLTGTPSTVSFYPNDSFGKSKNNGCTTCCSRITILEIELAKVFPHILSFHCVCLDLDLSMKSFA